MVESVATFRARWVPRSVSRNRDMWSPPPAESAFGGGGGGKAAIAGAWGAAATTEEGEEGLPSGEERRISSVRFSLAKANYLEFFFICAGMILDSVFLPTYGEYFRSRLALTISSRNCEIYL